MVAGSGAVNSRLTDGANEQMTPQKLRINQPSSDQASSRKGTRKQQAAAASRNQDIDEIPQQETHWTEHDLSSQTQETWVEHAFGDSTKFATALSSASTACLDAPEEITIKIENPNVETLREQSVILRLGKGALEKRLSERRDMEVALTSRSKTDVGLHAGQGDGRD